MMKQLESIMPSLNIQLPILIYLHGRLTYAPQTSSVSNLAYTPKVYPQYLRSFTPFPSDPEAVATFVKISSARCELVNFDPPQLIIDEIRTLVNERLHTVDLSQEKELNLTHPVAESEGWASL